MQFYTTMESVII